MFDSNRSLPLRAWPAVLAALSVGIAPPLFASTVQVDGLPGVAGTLGAPGGPGTPGTNGGDALAVINPGTDASNSSVANGGAGGAGGQGGSATAGNPIGGAGANGGAGGAAESRLVTNVAADGTHNVVATGGAGGSGGAPGLIDGGSSKPLAASGDGGTGGGAIASLNLTAPANDVALNVGAIGGRGGNAQWAGSAGNGGNGGNAKTTLTADVYQFSSNPVWTTAGGGDGGNSDGLSGRGGDADAASIITVRHLTYANIYTLAHGGDGGSTSSGTGGGDGGNAKGQLALSTVTPAGQPGFIQASLLVKGGNGGSSSGDGGDGGTATGTMSGSHSGGAQGTALIQLEGGNGGDGLNAGQGADVSSTNPFTAFNFFVVAQILDVKGGHGGSANSGLGVGIAGTGGDATAIQSNVNSKSRVESYALGGNGGGGRQANGGNGGSALAITRISGIGTATAIAEATGGLGGDSWFANGGHGGSAALSTTPTNGPRVATTNGLSAKVRGVAIGGSGGSTTHSESTGHGGNGASVMLNNVVSAATLSPLQMEQIAVGGSGGYAYFGQSGQAGSAGSHLQFSSISSELDVLASATGGSGGTKFAAGGAAADGADGVASAIITGMSSAMRIITRAVGGVGGGADYGAVAGDGGDATATTDVSSSWSNDTYLSATAEAGAMDGVRTGRGGSGMGNSSAGNGGDATANATARSSGASETYANATAVAGDGGYGFSDHGHSNYRPDESGDGGHAVATAIAGKVEGGFGGITGAVASATGGGTGVHYFEGTTSSGRSGNATALARADGGTNNSATAYATGGAAQTLDKVGNSYARAEADRSTTQAAAKTLQESGLRTYASAELTQWGTISETRIQSGGGLPGAGLAPDVDAATFGTVYPDAGEFADALSSSLNAAAALATVDMATANLVAMGVRGSESGAARSAGFSTRYVVEGEKDFVVALMLPEFTSDFDIMELFISYNNGTGEHTNNTYAFHDVATAEAFFDDHVFRFGHNSNYAGSYSGFLEFGIKFFGGAGDAFSFQVAVGQAAVVPLPGTVWLLLTGLAIVVRQGWRPRCKAV